MKLLSCIFVAVFATATATYSGSERSLWNLGQGVAQNAINVVENPSSITPDMVSMLSPLDIFNFKLNLLLGYPSAILMSLLNKVCAAAISSNVIQSPMTPDVSRMNFLFKTHRNQYNISLNSPLEIMTNPEFKHNATLVVFITGWTSDLTEKRDDVETMYQAYRCRNDVNFIVVDSGRYIDTLYSWASLNTEAIGEAVGNSLAKLSQRTFFRNIHVIGHSLGAQIAGAVGRYYHAATKKYIPHITGLDPARPCFKQGEVLTGLSRGDALYVDVIHTNPGIFGQKEAVGDVDFYPNGVNPIPPTCAEAACAHFMAWRLYAEAVYPGNEHAFKATKCNSLTALNTDRCRDAPTTFMGPNIDITARGNYFLRTNRKSPYGLDSDANKMHC